MDSTLWLPTAYEHIAKSTSSGGEASHFLSLAQLLPAAVQLFVSLFIGPLAGMAGSLKWPVCFLLLCSAMGNFIYSLGAPGAIHNVWAIVGARSLLGLASGSASLAMAYLTVSTAADKRIEAMSLFRTFGGVAMVLGPLLSIPLTRVHFAVGKCGFTVDGTNAPTFLAAFTSLVIASLVAVLLKDKSKPAHNAFVPLKSFFSAKDERWKTPCLVLGLMLVSAYLSANVLFLLSELLAHRWQIDVTLASGIQAIVFALSLLASIACGRLRQFILDFLQKGDAENRTDTVKADSTEAASQAAAKLHAEVLLTQASQVISVIAVLLILLSVCFKGGSAATAVVFAIGCTLAMMGYNIQAASLPSIFSQSIQADLRASLVPWYAATVAAGKLAAPPITETIGNSTGQGWAASQSVPLVLGMSAVAILALASKRLVDVCLAHGAR
ncbi:hypothetical protein EX895_005779 [Sporisorium graminicola]|uniref:Major facilitator superfamily (MFS) profile domain-containing protein n=1 Tax=Sporisorium graminicola TaxID=280036 RepID=A0A4U7KP76_9BASI|nr:hypothetical protein EX895_005779 [Sporisorium graminicola]TKY85617.1 hypothetical protein EX895_005779 [Sporisorium graminicola]